MSEEMIIKTEYSDIMQKSYIDYAMSVIVARALPDVRDGSRYREELSTICMSLVSEVIALTENVPVSLAIPWVNIILMETAPSMRHWLL